MPAAHLLDDWAEVLHKQFPDAGDAEVWRTVCMLLLVMVQPQPGNTGGVSAVTAAMTGLGS
jgi:hypothetical protein